MSLKEELAAITDLVAAARLCRADLGNADGRLRQPSEGRFIMIEEARVRWLLKAIANIDRVFPSSTPNQKE